jgi:hypothetical protein
LLYYLHLTEFENALTLILDIVYPPLDFVFYEQIGLSKKYNDVQCLCQFLSTKWGKNLRG